MLVAGISGFSYAQGTLIGDTAQAPHASSILELRTHNKGFLPPRMSVTERNAIQNPAIGLIIYNTTNSCIESFFPGGWKTIGCDCLAHPSALFTMSNQQPGINTPVLFTPDTLGQTYQWTFPSGSPASSSAQNPSVSWSQGGTYTVKLVVTGLDGCKDSSTQTISVVNCVSGGSFTFTNCTATGKSGPSQALCNAAYGPGVVVSTNGIQAWPVPAGVCSIQVEAWGAQGGSSTGGNGAYVKGTFAVTPGETLYVVVGQRGLGANNTWSSGGGGGGSFVWSSANPGTPMAVAGGGGGGNLNYSPCGLGLQGIGNSTTAGNGVNGAPGGTNGNGGSGTAPSGAGSGGAGWLSAGGNSSYGGGCTGGLSQGSFAGGNGYSGVANSEGGFGGGGGSVCGCGGGGGYSGGGGGEGSSCCSGGGGGSSFIGGTNTTTQSGVRTGHGQVTITW